MVEEKSVEHPDMTMVDVLHTLHLVRNETRWIDGVYPEYSREQQEALAGLYYSGLTKAIAFIRAKDPAAAAEYDCRPENTPTICLVCLECSGCTDRKSRCSDEEASHCMRLACTSERLLR